MKKLKKRLVKKKRVSKRHRATIKSLALSKVDKKYRRKFLVIQIDGLSITTLRKAMKKGYCNFLSKLVNEKGYEFQEYNCGIPSGTPVVQSAIMYGYNQKIPGFRFVMKDKKKQISFGNPGNVKYIYNKFFRKKKGILRNGSSYFNHFSGGAERAIFTMSHITKNKRFKRINESKLWLIMILNPMAFFRVLYYTLGEFLSEVCEYVWHLFTHFVTKKPAIFSLFNPFRRIFMTAIFQEMITMGVILDIKRGVPKIYMNYIGYDEMGHLRGPRSRPTYVSLRTIDRRIKRIFKSSKRENYDIFIISDHGQQHAVPFKSIAGMEISEFIRRATKIKTTDFTSMNEGRLAIARAALMKSLVFLRSVSEPIKSVGKYVLLSFLKYIKPKSKLFDWENEEHIFVETSCSLSHVYFNKTKKQMNLNEIKKRYPKLIARLVDCKAIGVVMVKDKNGYVLFGKGGTLHIGKKTELKGVDFLSDFGDSKVLLEQFKYFSKVEYLGDIVLFGNTIEGVTVSFTDHVGSHGGIGKEMTNPFFMSTRDLDLRNVTSALQLHEIFAEYGEQ